MATDLQVSNISADNGKSSFRSQRIKSGGREIITPSRALEPARLEASVPIRLHDFGLADLYREISGTLATNCAASNDVLEHLSERLRASARRVPLDVLRVCVTKFVPDRTMPWPDDATVDLLSDVSHTYSDVVPLPTIGMDFNLESAARAIQFLKSCYKSVERLNNKPIMGALPALPREAQVKLLDFYIDQGLTAFYFDFSGKVPDQLKLRSVLARLSERKVLNRSFIYGINARPGRLLRNADAILSRDFMAYGYGLDVLGGRHFRVFVPGATALKGRVRQAAEVQSENRRRLFVRRDYGYHRADEERVVRALYPKDTAVPLRALLSTDYGRCGPLFNMEQQSAEAANLARRLGSLDRGETILDYISTKDLAKPEIPKLRRSSQRNLRAYE
jgi:hypothetical protein